MASKIKIFFYFLLFSALVFLIFKNWFLNPEIIGGDWPYFQAEALKDYSLWPELWAPWLGNGMGAVNPLLGLYFFQALLIVIFTQLLHIPWTWVYKIGWFGLFIFLSAFSTVDLLRSVFHKEKLKAESILIGSLLYLTNTYALMLVSGGQMGVAIAYALAPLVLSRTIGLVDSVIRKKELLRPLGIAALVLGLQIMIDARIAYVTLIAVFVYYLINIKNKTVLFANTIVLSVTGFIALVLNAFWLAPLLFLRTNPLDSLGTIYTSVGALNFFSFADFSHAFSLLQPNWPENVFGKTYFLQPEFLLIPIIAFSPLLLTARSGAKKIFFLAIVGIVGVFLSKGVKEPFGMVYAWLFEHVPGFIMFRDPSKFYVLTSLSYSCLIAYTLDRYHFIGKKIILIFFIAIWLFTIRQAFFGHLQGTFVKREVPSEYIAIKSLFVSQPEYYRELWVPRFERLGFASNDRTGIESEPLFQATSASELALALTSKNTRELLERRAIKYVVLPSDPFGDIFLSDRKYDDTLRKSYKSVLDAIPWLKKQYVGNIGLYETPFHRDHFWLEPEGNISYKRMNQSTYKVTVTINKPSTLVFSETYHPGWEIRENGTVICSQMTDDSLNSFFIGNPGNHEFLVMFAPQVYVDYGLSISGATLGVVLFFLLRRKFATIGRV